ncbi:MAG: hypothetical protein K2X90_01655 [Candidatus Babeliaceae bacterium]|nr:hypothetical protein [Candidatus Babeliaceae bacterium]
MKKIAYLVMLTCNYLLIQSFNIPKFYHGRVFLDEPRFSETGLFSADLTVAGGTKHFRARGYKGHLELAELYLQAYQNFDKGLFIHAFLPFCWVRMNDVERYDLTVDPLPHCIKKTDIYSPGLFAGWTINYQETKHVDYVDATFELGMLLNTPKNAISVPLFPVGYTQQPGFAGAAYFAMGAYEWLTLGLYTQAISFQPATLWSTGSYIKLDHIVPKISVILAFCGDGQNKKIESINPWHMFSIYFSFDVDLATDERPWLPRFKALYTKPVSGYNILKAGMGGFSIGLDAQVIF